MPEEGKQMVRVKSKVLREGKTTEEKKFPDSEQNPTISFWYHAGTSGEHLQATC